MPTAAGRLAFRKRPLIAAHRGSSGVAPENTLASFRTAITEGADMIELDVRMTKDFELVVLHDRSVNRTTNGRGLIRDLTLSDLRRLDAGVWFNRKFAGEQIPTLSEVIAILPSNMKLNIEVKTDGEPRRKVSFREALSSVIRTSGIVDRVLVSSFDHTFLRQFHQLDPAIPLGALYSPVRDIAKKPSALARRIGASTFVCSIAQLRNGIAEDVHASGITLAVYGVNTRTQFEKAMKFGAGIIVTDFPKEILRMLA